MKQINKVLCLYQQLSRFKTYIVCLESYLQTSRRPGELTSSSSSVAAAVEHSVILESPISETDESVHGSEVTAAGDNTIDSSSTGVSAPRSTSDRYSYHAAIYQQSQLEHNY